MRAMGDICSKLIQILSLLLGFSFHRTQQLRSLMFLFVYFFWTLRQDFRTKSNNKLIY